MSDERTKFIHWLMEQERTGEMLAAHVWDNNYSSAQAWRAALAAAPAQEHIDALELEVRQQSKEIAGLRGDGVAILFEHEDGRYAVNPDTTGDPAWHRLGPVDVSAIRSQQPTPSAAPAEPPAEIENLRKALQFYADGDHFGRSDDTAWDTVSGEPQNWWCDEAGTATVEDGSLSRMALAGHPFPEGDLDDETPTPQADSQPAPVLDALPREDFAWLVVQEACETEPADEDDPECIRILRLDLKSAVLAAFLRHDAARAAADSVLEDAALLHYALADGGNQSMNWQDIYEDWSGEGHFIDALRTAYRLDAARKQGANHD